MFENVQQRSFSKAVTPNDYEFLSKAVQNETRVVAGVAVVIVGGTYAMFKVLNKLAGLGMPETCCIE